MAYLDDVPEAGQQVINRMECPTFDNAPFVAGHRRNERQVAIVSTAGPHRRDDHPFAATAFEYRVIPGDIDAGDILMSLVSPDFDRTGFQTDVNLVFPLERLRELEAGERSGLSPITTARSWAVPSRSRWRSESSSAAPSAVGPVHPRTTG